MTKLKIIRLKWKRLKVRGSILDFCLLYLCVPLVFPTKGSSLPSDPMTPLSSHELLFFPFWVDLPLGGTSSLSLLLFIFSSELPSPILHSILLFIFSGLWRFHDYILVSLMCVGSNFDYSWQGICSIGNSSNGIETGSYLQKISRKQYSQRKYWAAEDISCSEQTHWPNMGSSIMYPKRNELTMRFRLSFGP